MSKPRSDLDNQVAELLVTGSVPAVWVPPVPVRELRSLLAHRQRLVQQRTAMKNRLRNLLLRHHLVPPAGELFAAHQSEFLGWP